MRIEVFIRLTEFVILLLVQVLVFNHVHLFGCAIPLVYLYCALDFRRGYPKWAILLWCFAMGLAIDTFSNTQGVAAASMTFIGLLQPYVFKLFTPRDSAEDLAVSKRTIGFLKYSLYSLMLIFIYCTVLFSLETFYFFNWEQWAMSIGGSTLLTWIIIIALENIRN